jgi:hypothetical protein
MLSSLAETGEFVHFQVVKPLGAEYIAIPWAMVHAAWSPLSSSIDGEAAPFGQRSHMPRNCFYCNFLPFLHLPTPCSLSRITEMTCASDKPRLLTTDQSHFQTDGNVHWDAHRIGWAIAGAGTAVVRVYATNSFFSF